MDRRNSGDIERRGYDTRESCGELRQLVREEKMRKGNLLKRRLTPESGGMFLQIITVLVR
jgi:hypothetical protein